MSPPPEKFELVCTWANRTNRVTVGGPVTLGRKDTCEVVLPLVEISRQHARIEPAGEGEEGWKLVDLGSRNGTELNGTRIDGTAPLRNGDVIRIGGATARVQMAGAPEPAPVRAAGVAPAGGLGASTDFARTIVAARPIQEVLGAIEGAETLVGTAPSADVRGAALNLASEAAEALLQHENLDDSLQALLRIAAMQLPAERAAIALIGRSGSDPVVRASIGFDQQPAISRQVVSEVIDGRSAVLIEDVGADDSIASGHTLMRAAVRSVIAAPLYHRGKVEGLIYLDNKGGGRGFKADDLDLLAALGRFAAIGIDQHRVREAIDVQRKIQSRLERYASPAVVERVIQTTSRAGMIAEERIVTVLFADLVGFTTMSETRTPIEVAELLNGAFDRLTEAVFAHEGTLDKYMGDGMMAFFGAPAPDSQHALKAVRAAWDMQQALAELNREQGLDPPLRMRVGLNTGSVIVGDIGSRRRRDYTVVGDTVNVASRLEGVAGSDQIVIGDLTREQLGDAFALEQLEPVQVKGRTEPVVPSRVVAPR